MYSVRCGTNFFLIAPYSTMSLWYRSLLARHNIGTVQYKLMAQHNGSSSNHLVSQVVPVLLLGDDWADIFYKYNEFIAVAGTNF